MSQGTNTVKRVYARNTPYRHTIEQYIIHYPPNVYGWMLVGDARVHQANSALRAGEDFVVKILMEVTDGKV